MSPVIRGLRAAVERWRSRGGDHGFIRRSGHRLCRTRGLECGSGPIDEVDVAWSLRLQQGDDTPRRLGHITLNPIVHMGWMAVIVLLLAGIAWGQTPVNPARFRSRHGGCRLTIAEADPGFFPFAGTTRDQRCPTWLTARAPPQGRSRS